MSGPFRETRNQRAGTVKKPQSVEKSICGRLNIAVTDLTLADLRATKVSVAKAIAIAERDTSAKVDQLHVRRVGTRIEFAVCKRRRENPSLKRPESLVAPEQKCLGR